MMSLTRWSGALGKRVIGKNGEERGEKANAAEDSRTPKRKRRRERHLCPKVLECGCPLPLSSRRTGNPGRSSPWPANNICMRTAGAETDRLFQSRAFRTTRPTFRSGEVSNIFVKRLTSNVDGYLDD